MKHADKVDAMAIMWNTGNNAEVIGLKFNISRNSVLAIASRNRDKFPFREKKKVDLEYVREMRQRGLTYDEIGNLYGLSSHALRHRLYRESGTSAGDVYRPVQKPHVHRDDTVVWTTYSGAKVTLPRVRFLEGSV